MIRFLGGLPKPSTLSTAVQVRTTYKLVTNDPVPQTFHEIADKAAQSIFWTELFRGNTHI